MFAFSFYISTLVGIIMPADHQSLSLTLQLAQRHGYYASKVDWLAVSDQAKKMALRDGEDKAIHAVVAALKDGHSFYRPAAKPNVNFVSSPEPVAAATDRRNPLFEIRPAFAGITTIRIHGWTGSNTAASSAIEQFDQEFSAAQTHAACGVILDFSKNTGGNMWPMLLGLSPFLTEGALGAFQDAQGGIERIEKKSAAIWVDGQRKQLNQTLGATFQFDQEPIAIVVGSQTASSGEIVPILFQTQANVRIFGNKTAGVATANRRFALPNGGQLNLTTAVTLNRARQMFERHLTPDVITTTPLKAASDWILAKCQPVSQPQ
jgi:hypothetical protein